MYNTLEEQQQQAATASKKSGVRGPSEKEVFTQVLFHCVLIILCPIATFFLLKIYLFDAYLELASLQANLYSAFAAVIVLHLALGNFIYKAYFGSETIPGFDKLVKED